MGFHTSPPILRKRTGIRSPFYCLVNMIYTGRITAAVYFQKETDKGIKERKKKIHEENTGFDFGRNEKSI